MWALWEVRNYLKLFKLAQNGEVDVILEDYKINILHKRVGGMCQSMGTKENITIEEFDLEI